MSEQTFKIPATAMRAAFSVGTANEETRTVELIWTTGARVLRTSWSDGQFYEELSVDPKHVRMDLLNSGRAPFLANHDMRSINSVLGVIESARIENGKGIAVVRFAKGDPEADAVWNKVRQGILPNVSVGYRIHKFEKVSGGDKETPVFRATDWQPHEVSLVPVGADNAAHIRSNDTEMNPCVFTNRGAPQTEEQKMSEITPPAPADQAALLEARAAGAKLERERVSGINAAVRAAKLDESVARELVDGGTDLAAARAIVLERLANASDEVKTEQHTSATVTDDQQDKFVRGVSAWLFEKAGNGLVDAAKARGAKGFEAVETNGAEFRGMSLIDIARECLERRGVSTRGMYNKMALVEKAMAHRSGYSAASDFAVLFENVMHKQMRAAYAVQADSWRRFMGTDTVSDFRSANRFLNGSFGGLDVVPENGEYKNKAIPDGAKTSISVETRGGIIGISRQAIINDDMGALASQATAFGRSAGLSIEIAAYAQLALNSGLGPTMSDSQPFFHSNRSNVSTAAALSVAALDADKVKMRQQMDLSSNEYLDLNPSILLLPVGLESAAKVINASTFDHDGTKLQKPNPVQGMFTDIVSSPRLSWSTTRRYLFTAGKEAFKVVFLEGTGEGPVMESQEGFRRDGIEWKVRIDFKVNPFDPKHALTNAGA